MLEDIPLLDDEVTKLPTDIVSDLAARAANDLYFLAKGVLGYTDMTPKCHLPLAEFLQRNKKQFKLILMPRDHFKTTLVTISGTIQKVVRNPEERILIANESATNAERFIRSIRQHAESNRVFRSLFGNVIPKDTRKVRWNDSELDFQRQGHYPEPTIDTIGMTGAVTSRHYTHMTFDDPISEEAIKSEKVMQDTLNRMSAIQSLLVKPETDTVWLVGTRWAYWDVYSWYEKAFGLRLGRYIRAAIENGEPIFPELVSLETLAIKRRTMGDYKFSCLYMNNPRNSDTQDLNTEQLRYGRLTETHFEILGETGNVERSWRLDQLDTTTTVDLAPAETATSDRNAIVTVGMSPLGELCVLDVFAKRCPPSEVMAHLFWLKQRFQPRVFGIEDVAYQKAFKYFLKDQATERGIYLRVEPIKATGKKETRIRGLQPLMAMGKVFVQGGHQLLIQEMTEFPLGEHDDAVDALSMHLQLFRGRLSADHIEKVETEIQRIMQRTRVAGGPRWKDNQPRNIPDADAVRRSIREDAELEFEELTLAARERLGGFEEVFSR